MNNKNNTLFFHIFLATFILFYACKDNKRKEEATKIVNEWTGKEIRFPENVPCFVSGKDTLSELCDDHLRKEFKILLYVDSAGCSSCRLKLFEWKQLMEEADSIFQGRVGFLLFFQPKDVKEMGYLFVRDRFDYPVFMDTNGTINRLNHFPQTQQYQCFLLDSSNKVMMVGNPVSNYKIWELYKEQISGVAEDPLNDLKGLKASNTSNSSTPPTTINLSKSSHNFRTIRKGSSNPAFFTIENTGNSPLIIHRVSASCGCTNVEWDKQPVEPGKTATIRVEMKPEETGYFSKTVDVYCNADVSPVRLIVTGTTIEN